jgi:hypothetical protein
VGTVTIDRAPWSCQTVDCVCDVRELPVTQRHTLLNLGRAQTAVTKESRKAPTTRHAKNTLSAFGELPGAHAGSIGATPSGRPSPRTGNGRSANLQCLLLVRSSETAAADCRAGHALDCGQSNSLRPSVTAKKLHWTPPTLPVITDDPHGRACLHHKQEKTGKLLESSS